MSGCLSLTELDFLVSVKSIFGRDVVTILFSVLFTATQSDSDLFKIALINKFFTFNSSRRKYTSLVRVSMCFSKYVMLFFGALSSSYFI